ncbi:MAG: MBL fold metallo-hydrolase [Anaerolineae bacterium]
MRIQFWGVRGSIARPEPSLSRYGGNTACVTVETTSGHLIVLDAGTGFCRLGDALMAREFSYGQGELTLLLSHHHLDHILGFLFPAPVYIPGNRFNIYGPTRSRQQLQEIHEGLVSPSYSPLHSLSNMGATFNFHPNRPSFTVDGVQITSHPLPHGDMRSWGYRFDEEGKSLVYMTDVGYPQGVFPAEILAFARDADVLIHDAHWAEHNLQPELGHSTSYEAVDFALAAEIRHLIFFHHHPNRSDDAMDELLSLHRDRLAQQGQALTIEAAREGKKVAL